MEFVNKKYKFVDYIKIPFNISPIFTILIVFLDFVIALIPSVQVMATASFIDTAVNIFLNDAELNIYIPIFLIVALILISWTSSIIMKFAKLKLKLYVDENIKLSMVEKRNNLKYKHIENEVTWDLIRRIGEEPSEQIVKGFENIINLIQYIIRIISLLLIIMAQIWWVAIIVLIIAYALFKLSSYAGKVDYDAFVESEKHLRKADYLKEILSSRDSINERTLFGYSENIGKRWLDKFKVAKTIEMKAMKNNFIKLKTASSITAILSMLIALILLEPLKSKVITAGMYIGLVSAAFNLVQQMSWDFSYEMQEFAKNKIYLNDLTKFSQLEEIDKDSELTKFPISLQQFEEIEFKDVFFSYPDTENYILKGLNLKIEKNKKYALVGKNGAGKTTITKLLTGLYDNYSGLILINGKDIKEWNKQELRNYFSIVYQDFAQYQISLRDNIKLGMVGEDLPEKKLKDVLESAGLLEMVENLPNGVDAHLGKLFDKGVDVSGGQWQKIAMARALVGNTQINIFDEPTKALDPISESKVYEDFANFSQEKTTILITHRLGAARIADEIILIDEGISKEQGSHDELVEKNGLYKTMFLSQRRWYDEN